MSVEFIVTAVNPAYTALWRKQVKQLYRATFQGFERGFFVADIDRMIVLIHHTTSDAMLKKVISSLTQFSNFVEVQSSLTFKGLFNP